MKELLQIIEDSVTGESLVVDLETGAKFYVKDVDVEKGKVTLPVSGQRRSIPAGR